GVVVTAEDYFLVSQRGRLLASQAHSSYAAPVTTQSQPPPSFI
ncbi:unnamed protein product, partial [Brassica oleracea]